MKTRQPLRPLVKCSSGRRPRTSWAGKRPTDYLFASPRRLLPFGVTRRCNCPARHPRAGSAGDCTFTMRRTSQCKPVDSWWYTVMTIHSTAHRKPHPTASTSLRLKNSHSTMANRKSVRRTRFGFPGIKSASRSARSASCHRSRRLMAPLSWVSWHGTFSRDPSRWLTSHEQRRPRPGLNLR